MLKKIENALKHSKLYSNITKVIDFECLDEKRQMYYVGVDFPEKYSMKILATFAPTNNTNELVLVGGAN